MSVKRLIGTHIFDLTFLLATLLWFLYNRQYVDSIREKNDTLGAYSVRS